MKDVFTMKWLSKKDDEGKLLRDFLQEQRISKAALTDIKFKGGFIFVNGKEVNVRYPLKQSDEIELYFPPEIGSETMKGEDIPLSIVYEDDYLLVLDKSAGVNTIPSREHPSGSIANGLAHYYEEIGHKGAVHIVTRLDRDTSGLMLIAKHRHIHHLFSFLQQKKKVSRRYLALVEGCMQTDEGAVERPIGRKESSIIEREVRPDGQYAYTEYQVVKRLDSFTVVELLLGTGRTHQIRVHMAYLGHPLLGDELYGGSRNLIARQALHCKRLTFLHPVTGETLAFQSNPPTDMRHLFEKQMRPN